MHNMLRQLFPPNDPYQNQYNVTTNQFYLAFWRDGISTSFLWLVAIRWAIAMVGALLNLFLFCVIVINRHILIGTCNMFIALNAIFTTFFELSLTITLAMQLMGNHIVTLKTCFAIQVFPIIFRNLIISTLFIIGADRLISVIFVLWHRTHGQSMAYRGALFLFAIGHAIVFVAFSAAMAAQMPNLNVICLSSDECYQGDNEKVLFLINAILLLLILFSYLLIWLSTRFYIKNANIEAFSKRIIKSLTVTAVVISLGWLSYNGLQAMPLLHWMSLQAYVHFSFGASFLPYIAMAMNAPLYFFLSNDYHSAFLKIFQLLRLKGAQVSSDLLLVVPANTRRSHQQQSAANANVAAFCVMPPPNITSSAGRQTNNGNGRNVVRPL